MPPSLLLVPISDLQLGSSGLHAPTDRFGHNSPAKTDPVTASITPLIPTTVPCPAPPSLLLPPSPVDDPFPDPPPVPPLVVLPPVAVVPLDTVPADPDRAANPTAGCYGTEKQIIILVDKAGKMVYVERTLYDSDAKPVEKALQDRRFELQIEDW